MNADLWSSIILTIKYFDLFDYPLKKEEIWQWLFCAPEERLTWEEAKKVIDNLTGEQKIVIANGFYFLLGREKIVALRKEREEISRGKIKKAQKMARVIAWVPGVRMIAICSNLGYLNAEQEADIDFFIVTKRGRIWSARFWSVALMKFLGQRPNSKTAKDKICLSYFVSEDNLDLKSTAIGEPDRHLVYLLSQYLPIYSEDNLWSRLVVANSWIKNYLPNFNYGPEAERFLIRPKFMWLKKIIGKTQFDWEEARYKKIQLKIMPPVLKEMMKCSDKKVIINDQMLKLHSNDKREEINRVISKIQETISK